MPPASDLRKRPHESHSHHRRGREDRQHLARRPARPLPGAAPVRHRAARSGARRRRDRAEPICRSRRRGSRHEGRRLRRPSRRDPGRGHVGQDPAQQRGRNLERVRGGAAAGRAPRRLCELASRGRLLSARPRHRPDGRSAAGRHLRGEQGVRRGGRPPVRRQARPVGRVPAHRRLSRQADGPAPALCLAQPARRRAPGPDAASTRPTIIHHGVRRLRQRAQPLPQAGPRFPRLSAAGQGRRTTRPTSCARPTPRTRSRANSTAACTRRWGSTATPRGSSSRVIRSPWRASTRPRPRPQSCA